ncbi:hypothetical protein DFH28DRAFT_1161031 [Melampsora americana]|nr:hypothetical protein DFH28DRAFT_1161031 [Melampsora americana]
MKTRKRDYSTNPRLPPKQRRRTGKRKKEILPELQSSSMSIYPNSDLILPSKLPNKNLVSELSTLPPLPNLPILQSSETLSSPPITPHPTDTLKRPSLNLPELNNLPPLPDSPVHKLDLTSIFSRLNLHNSKELLLHTVKERTVWNL